MYYNHEGYKDPTAGIAIITVVKEGKNRRKSKKGIKHRVEPLTFKIGEIASYRTSVEELKKGW